MTPWQCGNSTNQRRQAPQLRPVRFRGSGGNERGTVLPRVIAHTHARPATCVVNFLHGQLLSPDWMAPASLARRIPTSHAFFEVWGGVDGHATSNTSWMSELTKQLEVLKDELKILIPRALEGLVASGALEANDPMDAVGICYADGGSDSIYHCLSVRTVNTRLVLEGSKHIDDSPWNCSEYGLSYELEDLTEVGEVYSNTCERLTELIIDVTDARDPVEDGGAPEFKKLRATVIDVAKWLTQHWKPESFPSTAHPIFFAINHYLDHPGDSVARSVDPAAMLLAGLRVPPMMD